MSIRPDLRVGAADRSRAVRWFRGGHVVPITVRIARRKHASWPDDVRVRTRLRGIIVGGGRTRRRDTPVHADKRESPNRMLRPPR